MWGELLWFRAQRWAADGRGGAPEAREAGEALTRPALPCPQLLCTAVAILLHYFFLSTFAWLLVQALHLYRMRVEPRNVDRGAMRFYHALGWGVPAVLLGEGPARRPSRPLPLTRVQHVARPLPPPPSRSRSQPQPSMPSAPGGACPALSPASLENTPLPSCPFPPPGLAVGLDPEGYGNPDFCWISVHEPLIWSFAGPVVLVIVVSALLWVPPVCSPWRGQGTLQRVRWYRLRGAGWQSTGFLALASTAVPTQLARRWRLGRRWLSLPLPPWVSVCLSLLPLSVPPWFPISGLFYDSRLLRFSSLSCVCVSLVLPLWSLSLTISIFLCPAPTPHVRPGVQMTGSISLLAARTSCSTGQREAKKNSVL